MFFFASSLKPTISTYHIYLVISHVKHLDNMLMKIVNLTMSHS